MSSAIAIVLGFRYFDFQGSDGWQIRSFKIDYITPYVENSEDRRGSLVNQVAAPLSAVNSLTELPALCELETASRPGRNNKPEIQVVGVKFLRAVSLFPKG